MSVKISCWASYFTQKKSFFLARACEEGTDEKRKLYAVIASNDQPFVIQIHQTKISMDLPTHAPQHKWRTTHSQNLQVLLRALE